MKSSYVSAPRMAITQKVGKGLVFFNSVVRESSNAIKNDQKTIEKFTREKFKEYSGLAIQYMYHYERNS